MRWMFTAAVCAVLLLGVVAGAQDAMPGDLYVDVGQSLGAISPYVRASNYGQSAVPGGLVEEAQNLDVAYLRLGGGFSDQNDLHTYDIDNFMLGVRITSAVPGITVRLHGGSPELSAENVRYANIEKGYNIRYWSIGNEPNLFTNQYGDDYTTEQFVREWRAHAEAMLAVDPNIIFVGPDISQYPGVPDQNPKDSQGNDWMEEFLKANGDLVDIVSIHRYPFPRGNAPITIDDLRGNPREWDDNIIPDLRAVIQATVGHDLPVAVTEVNSSWATNSGGEATMDSHYNAIWYADVLGRLIRQGVTIAAYWNFQSVETSFGILVRYEVRPVYYTFLMYKMFGTEALMSDSSDPDVSVFAARRDDGALTVMVVNRGLDETTKSITLDNFTPAGEAEVWLFDPDHNAEAMGTQPWESTITVPGQSVTLYVVPAA
ncbi:MAG: hypothetical protein KJ065_21960 [Anaerolineae bacterium]|nr:hypothetical protein [Anaerolineae bacterium]